ncbi:MAG TPA: glycine--tRNA ligase subunit beta [Thermoanaerobaculia bacterium]|nr:glycine--tRNA ligase subunit beta [Thermoanaerobaculia bacterium]
MAAETSPTDGRHDLLLEVRAEEIPARMLRPAAEELATLLRERLDERGLALDSLETAFTPRRLVLFARGLAAKEPDREEQVTGPPVAVAFRDGQPTPAALGFAKRCGVAPAELARVVTEKGEYVAAVQRTAGRPTREVLAELLPDLLGRLSWPKTMRWGEGEGPWVRPVHGVLALYAGEVVPFSLFGVAAGAETVGHPVLSPEPFAVDGEVAYREALGARHVEVRPAARAEHLLAAMTRHAGQVGGELVEDPPLLDKLAAICEIPGVLVGALDEEFLELPREVLVESLREHQSAFTVQAPAETAGGPRRLLPWFLTVMDRPDDPAGRVRSGNEWVVAARLADARFFYREDRKRTLAERRGDLARLTFHVRLGSYLDKSARLERLAETLCGQLGWGAEVEHAVTAAGLAKVDLTCEMVKEFTDLQGVMGGIYAREEGSPEPVWQAIYDQYLPASTDDPLPRGRAGLAVALADRVDTLVGMFGLGLVPSGSRDPFGLRRAAQGVVRIALEGELAVDLDLLAVKAARLYRDQLGNDFAGADDVLTSLRPFLHDRVRHLLGLAGYAYDEVEAALAVGGGDLTDLAARVAALHEARRAEAFLSVVLAAKRIANILRDQEEQELDESALAEPAEQDLHAAWRDLRGEIDEAAAAGDYAAALAGIARFAEVLDRFFVEVLVMAEDRRLRRNRIALLQAIHRTVSRVARLTEMVVDKDEYRKS